MSDFRWDTRPCFLVYAETCTILLKPYSDIRWKFFCILHICILPFPPSFLKNLACPYTNAIPDFFVNFRPMYNLALFTWHCQQYAQSFYHFSHYEQFQIGVFVQFLHFSLLYNLFLQLFYIFFNFCIANSFIFTYTLINW